MTPFADSSIAVVPPKEEEGILPELIELLKDTVESGASVGFIPPLGEGEARQYWQGVFRNVKQGTHILLVAREDGRVVGSVQLELATKANALHRAEVQKLFVLQSQRRRGTGRTLMQAIEQVAHEHKRTLLVLDTREGDVAEKLYRKIGYQEVGVIPAYALNANGELDGTIIFYKTLLLA
jgi:acetyltransferase